MKESNKKITTILIFLVLIGTFFANINVIASIVPSNIQANVSRKANQEISDDTNELDYTSVSEISNYLQEQAGYNDFKFSAIVYSAGLLFESEISLIVIGHGNFDTRGQYYIGDFSSKKISKIAEEKEMVALLSCYSSNVELENNLQLTYEEEIDIASAINELFKFLKWNQNAKFSPTNNIRLHDLDPGLGGGFDPNSPPAYFMNGYKMAQSRSTYWNLRYESALISLTNYMLSNIGIRVEFSFSTTFYEEVSTDNWVLKSHTATYDAWTFIEGDMKTYIKINNIVIDGSSKNKQISVKVDDLMVAVSQDGINGFLQTMQYLAGIFAGIAGVFITGYISVKIAIAVSTAAAALVGLATLCACLAIAFGFLTLYAIIACVVISLVWI